MSISAGDLFSPLVHFLAICDSFFQSSLQHKQSFFTVRHKAPDIMMKFLSLFLVFGCMLTIVVATEGDDHRRGLLRHGRQRQQQHNEISARGVFDMATVARDMEHPDINTMHHIIMASVARDMEHPDMNAVHHIYHDNRRLQQMQFACSIQLVYAGNCTLMEYCAELNTIDPGTNVTCSGKVTDLWSIATHFPEACIYSSKGMRAGQPFDTKKYVKGIDVCAAPLSKISYLNGQPSVFEKRYRFTRPPYKGVLREFYDLEFCGKMFPGQVLPGVCDTFSGAKINGMDCNSSTGCAKEDMGKRSIDCSNISPELVNTCDTRDENFYGLVTSYLATKDSSGN